MGVEARIYRSRQQFDLLVLVFHKYIGSLSFFRQLIPLMFFKYNFHPLAVLVVCMNGESHTQPDFDHSALYTTQLVSSYRVLC